MPIPFRLPDLGEGTTEAELVRWLVKEGEKVEKDQIVAEVMTDKATVELPAPGEGVITQLRFQAGETVPVGEILYIIETVQPDEMRKPKRVLASPTTRKLARELGVDLTKISGSGPNGRVEEKDIQIYVQSFRDSEREVSIPPIPDPINREHPYLHEETPLSSLRKVIADKLVYSVTNKPHVTHFAELDVTGLVAFKEKFPSIGYTPILLKFIAYALKEHPEFNAHFDEDRKVLQRFSTIALGVATDTPRGVIVPVIREVESKNILQLAHEVEELTEAVRRGACSPAQLRGSTFTVSNMGPYGGTWATPIIQPPEVAILAIHPIERRVIVTEEGQMCPAWRMNISLSFDHRILDGADAVRFTQTLEKYTKEPDYLLAKMI
jgi:pyruvate dehydrogenase E2 component (dihydrolipoamide acetyltransferase)